MGFRYIFRMTPLAQEDVDMTLSYITGELFNKTAAKELFRKLNKTIENICEFPMAYPGCEGYFISDDNYRHAVI